MNSSFMLCSPLLKGTERFGELGIPGLWDHNTEAAIGAGREILLWT